MKVLVLYDSLYGNTENIARDIASGFSLDGVRIAGVGECSAEEVQQVDMIVVGSPTHRWGPSQAMKGFLDALPPDSLKGKLAATFDTRVPYLGISLLSGSAARPLAGKLRRLGCKMVTKPVQFSVKGTEGPMLEGERERAAQWGKKLAALAATVGQ
jgi:flavodoxin